MTSPPGPLYNGPQDVLPHRDDVPLSDQTRRPWLLDDQQAAQEQFARDWAAMQRERYARRDDEDFCCEEDPEEVAADLSPLEGDPS